MKRRLASISAGGLTASFLVGAGMMLFLVGCGGSAASTVNNQLPPSAEVIVTPSSATVPVGRVQQFTSTVTPSGASQAVTWTVSGTGCTGARDRKSTRLNSSHGYISYAVFCLKKKNN